MEDLRALKSVRSDLKIGTVRADIHAVFTDTAAGQTATAFLFDLTAFRQVTLAVEDRFLGNECDITAAAPGNVPSALVAVMNAVVDEYSYILYHE